MKFLGTIKNIIENDSLKKLCEFIETLSENMNQIDLNMLTDKLNKISIKSSKSFAFSNDNLLKLFKDVIKSQQNNDDVLQDIPNFEEFIKVNENANKEKYLKGPFINL